MPNSLFTYYFLKTKFVPFLKSWPATVSCKKKDSKVGKKMLIKKKGKEKKRKRERKIEIDSQIKSQNFGLWACVKNKKAV